MTVQVVDANGRPDLRADMEVQFEVSGPGTIAAVGSGNGEDPDSYRSYRRKLYQGRTLVMIRTSRKAGTIKLIARGSGLNKSMVTIRADGVDIRPS